MSLYPVDRDDVKQLMREASAALGQDLPPVKDVFHFGDERNPASGEELLNKALRGSKTGTTTWPVPKPRHWDVGDLSIILNAKGEPVAVMRTLSLVECKFKHVTEEFALSEDEGSLEEFREGHTQFFKRQGKGHFDDESVVLTERFEIIYKRVLQS